MMRGYFGIGIERVHKGRNLGNLFRTAHGFGASFVFTIEADYKAEHAKIDTSQAQDNIPLYHYQSIDEMTLPQGCQVVGVELTDSSVELPSFRHPRSAIYILGSEWYGLTEETQARCDHMIQIPTKFSLNVATAGAIIMYDRMCSMGRFAERPVKPGGPTEILPPHVQGDPIRRKKWP